jgi:hypothetical protein
VQVVCRTPAVDSARTAVLAVEYDSVQQQTAISFT